jgi:conjugal transfer mating pair stabilization protein TraG
MAAIKDDPKAASILDFISGGVDGNQGGESAGNYNAVIGNAHSTRDLSQLSVNEVYQLQHELVQHGMPSSAVGRYQIIGSTLKGLVNQLGVDPTAKFTPELQDQLAIQLLKNRGYDRWASGQLSDQQFAHNLSEEWASLPDPQNGGKSHYDGVGPNHAGTTLGNVASMLKRAASGLGFGNG